MKILQASSEFHPYSKSGGLADMVGSLSKALAQAGHRVGVVTPLYKGIKEKFNPSKLDYFLELPIGTKTVKGEVYILEPMPNFTIYFIDQPAYFHRSSLYLENGRDFPDNAERFIFLSKAVVHLARFLPWQPEVIHVHDWQVGLVPALILHQRLTQGWMRAPSTCLTIHNLAYQGSFPRSEYALTNLPWEFYHIDGIEFYGGMNCLKAAISYADVITTVSPRYAREITTELYGCGLDAALRKRQGDLIGILNGVDYEEWNTTHNDNLKHPYSVENLEGKLATKLDLQKEFGLPVDPEIPLFGNISRLADQKGIDIQLGALEEMLASGMQFVLLGSGAANYERGYTKLAKRYPKKVGIMIGFDQALSHRIEAACDFYLMPSRFEPCGLNQLYSLRYGSIPIVRVTGGLDDSVIDISEDADKANGIKFTDYSVRALSKSMRKALSLYDNPELLLHFRENAMNADFSWDRTMVEYERVYEALPMAQPVNVGV